MTTDAPPETRDATADPDAAERIPATQRRGAPGRLRRVWATPNLEFTPVLVGVIAVTWFGLSFWQAVAACALGSALGGLAHGVLSSWGPASGLGQMALGRSAFGRGGNVLPAGLNAVTAVGWFAVRSVLGALALAALTGLPAAVALLVVVAAALMLGVAGHRLLHAFLRAAFPVLAVLLGLGAVSVLLDAHPGAVGAGGGFGGATLALSAAFGCTAAWTPYAADHSRYLPEDAGRLGTGLAAGLGNAGTAAMLMLVGAASTTIGAVATGDPVADLTGTMPGWIAQPALLAFTLGAVSASAVHVHSGTISLLATGIPVARRHATAALGLLGLVVAWTGLDDAAHGAESVVLVVAAWVAPWLGVVLTDRLLARGPERAENPAGPAALALALLVSVGLFSAQERHVGLVPGRWPGTGDLTPVVGLLLAGVLYALLVRVFGPRRNGDPSLPGIT